MKAFLRFFFLGFLGLIFFSPITTQYNTTTSSFIISPENTIIIFDLDDVLLFKKTWHIGLRTATLGLKEDFFDYYNYFCGILGIKKRYTHYNKQDGKKLYDNNHNEINGLTFHFLYHGMQDPRLRAYIPKMVETIEKSLTINKNTLHIIEKLKEKGYIIVFATNKDRVAYDFTVQHLGKRFTDLADMVFVAHPGNTMQFLESLRSFATTQADRIPHAYKQFLNHALNIKPTDTIYHVQAHKPTADYYHYVLSTINTKVQRSFKNVVFIDDNKNNIEGFMQLSPNDQNRIGIQFKNHMQLISDLHTHTVLSDQEKSVLILQSKAA